ncbi:MAG: PAS domain S-box protein [Candidatus Wallbacteria bacterium]|nr:PAS domain S-box protein [Candidatus Wallbacteria bacterium]
MRATRKVTPAAEGVFGFDASSCELRWRFLEFGARDVEVLRELHESLHPHFERIIDAFYNHLLRFDELKPWLEVPSAVARLKSLQSAYFEALTAGEYGPPYATERIRIGIAHQRVGLDMHWYLSAYCKYLLEIISTLQEMGGEIAPASAAPAFQALLKVVFFDMGVAVETYLRADRQAILGLKHFAESVVESVPDGLLVVDGDLRVRESNPAFSAYCGGSRDKLVRQQLVEVVPVDGIRELALEVLATGRTSRTFPAELTDEAGHKHSVDITLAPIELTEGQAQPHRGVLVVVKDLTEEERLRSQAFAAEARFFEVVENANDGIVTMGEDGRISYFNRAAEKLFGYGRGEVIGEPAGILIPRELRVAHDEGVRRAIATGGLSQTGFLRQVEGLRKDGSVVPLECTISSCRAEGSLVFTAILRDLSERQQLTARMMQMDRMITAGTMAAGVGHEINNPLTFVTGNIDFALESLTLYRGKFERLFAGLRETLGDEQASRLFAEAELPATSDPLADAREMLTTARYGSERIGKIVRDLKSLSRSETQKRQPVDPRRVFDAAAGIASNEVRHRAKLVKDYQSTPLVDVNESRLGQVLLNLIVNAAQAIPEGAAEQNEIRLLTAMRDGRVALEVRDSGSGITQENVDRIFEPFFTTKPVGQGTGLGLSICRQIVETFGGEIQVESSVGRGSTFRVLLPPSVGDRPAAAAEAMPASAPLRRGRILIVDDEGPIAQLASRALQTEHDVTTVGYARSALTLLDSGERYDIIFCDLLMPEMTGMELHAQILERWPEQAGRMVFTTGGAFTPQAQAFLERVPNRRIDKPFTGDRLRELAAELVK